MAITVDSVSHGNQNYGSSLTFSHTVTTGNLLLIGGVGGGSPTDIITSVTYNGDTCTRVQANTGSGTKSYAYELANPDVGTHDVVITLDGGGRNLVAFAVSLNDVDLGVPRGDGGGRNEFASSPYSNSITVPAGGVAVDFVGNNGPDFAAGSGQTELDEHTGAMRGACSIKTDATAMAWSWTGGAQQYTAQSIVALAAAGGGDSTAPVLTSPTGTQTGSTTGTGGATTDEANGTFYSVASTSSTAPTGAQVEAGQMHTGSAAAANANVAVSTTGAKTVNFTGLSPSSTYYAHSMHKDAAGNRSNVVTSSSFTTTSGGTGTVSKVTQVLYGA